MICCIKTISELELGISNYDLLHKVKGGLKR